MKSLKYVVIFSTIALFLVSACTNIIDPDDPFDNNRYRAESSFSFTIGAEDKSKLELTSINGDISVVGVENATDVVVAGRKVVKSDGEMDAEKYLKNLKVSIAESGNTLYVTSEQPENTHGRGVLIHYEVRVPAGWATVIDNINGNCDFDSLRGDIVGKLTNGNLFLGHTDASAYLRVTNGQIAGTVNVPQYGVLNAEVTSGQIAFNVPKTTSAKFTAKVTNGTVNVTGLSLDNMVGNQKEIHGTIGSGDGRIDLETTNGNISVVGL